MVALGCITQIIPEEGPHNGGIWVEVYGDGSVDLTDPTLVWYFGQPVEPVPIHSALVRLWTRSMPPNVSDANTDWLSVTTGDGTALGQAQFTWRAADDPLDTAIPPGRGRWRLTLHDRTFAARTPTASLLIAELTHAKSRRLEQELNKPAKLTFSLDGHDSAAALIKELQSDVMAWRWDEGSGRDVPVFRGVVSQSQDTLSEQTHTVNFTCFDYFAMFMRRFMLDPVDFTATPQDTVVMHLALGAMAVRWGAGMLPLVMSYNNPDGSGRPSAGPPRDRHYDAQASFGQAIDDLAHVMGGFDYDVVPDAAGGLDDLFRIFYPRQGIDRPEPLEYGRAIASVTRSTNSADYANHWRVMGSNQAGVAPAAYAVNADADDLDTVGTWQAVDSASDVTVLSTLQEKADGDLARSGILVPSYSIGLTPGAFHWDAINLGDDVPIVIDSGRLAVNSSLRVMGRTFDIGDDGEENVGLTVGRPLRQLADMLTKSADDVNALARR